MKLNILFAFPREDEQGPRWLIINQYMINDSQQVKFITILYLTDFKHKTKQRDIMSSYAAGGESPQSKIYLIWKVFQMSREVCRQIMAK